MRIQRWTLNHTTDPHLNKWIKSLTILSTKPFAAASRNRKGSNWRGNTPSPAPLQSLCPHWITTSKVLWGRKYQRKAPAVSVAPLHYHTIQKDFDTKLDRLQETTIAQRQSQSRQGNLDLVWWINRLQSFNGRSVVPPSADMTITTDASLQYSTLTSYRSALSATLPQIDGKQVRQHPMVVRLLQGMFNQRPLTLKYQEIWDVGLVVKHIQDGLRTVDLSLKELSKRTVTLLAICNASRASDIQALDIRFRRSETDNMVFTIQGLNKTRRSGPPKQVVLYHKLVTNEFTKSILQ